MVDSTSKERYGRSGSRYLSAITEILVRTTPFDFRTKILNRQVSNLLTLFIK